MSLGSLVIPYLTESPTNVQSVLYVLGTNASLFNSPKSEINVLVKRTIEYLRSSQVYKKWLGCHLAKIISCQPTILSNHVSSILNELLNLDNPQLQLIAENSILSICLNIKGKPALTRQVLTPKLPAIISKLLVFGGADEQQMVNKLSIITMLIHNHPTLFRPFGTKYEKALVTMLQDREFGGKSARFQEAVIVSFISLSLINKNPSLQWRIYLNSVLAEFKSVLQVLAQLKDGTVPASLELAIPTELDAHNVSHFSLEPLDINLNEIASLTLVNSRLNLLLKMLQLFLTTPLGNHIVSVPIQLYINVSTVLINTQLLGYSSSLLLGNVNLKNAMDYCFWRLQLNGVALLTQLLVSFPENSLTYFAEVSALIANCSNQYIQEYRQVISLASSLLRTFNSGNLRDFSFLLKVINNSLLLVDPSDTQIVTSKKPKLAIEIGDFLLTQTTLDGKLAGEIVDFYLLVIKNVSNLSLTQLNKIQTFAVLHSLHMIQAGGLPENLVQLLQSFVLYQNRNEKFSLLPIVVNLLNLAGNSNNEIIGLLINPRFPIVNKKEIINYDKDLEDPEQASEENPEEIEHLELVQSLKSEVDQLKEQLDQTIQLENKNRKQLERNHSNHVDKLEKEIAALKKQASQNTGTQAIPESKKQDSPLGSRKRKLSNGHETVSNAKTKVSEPEPEDDSDFDIPDIVMDSSDEE